MANEAWTILDKLYTVLDALTCLREVRMEFGTEETEIAATKTPACAILVYEIEESEEGVVADATEVQQNVHFTLQICVSEKNEKERVRSLIELGNAIRNAVGGDATLRAYKTVLGSMAHAATEDDAPTVVAAIPGWARIMHLTNTGR